ncbi:hypothetical protein BDR06DRAFT_350063 [Suillus hirtellus]|nr:hypothetical protein BDR06DRAFT_350063 [Suillus hirtellus]
MRTHRRRVTAVGAKNVVYRATLCWTLWVGLCSSKLVAMSFLSHGPCIFRASTNSKREYNLTWNVRTVDKWSYLRLQVCVGMIFTSSCPPLHYSQLNFHCFLKSSEFSGRILCCDVKNANGFQ